MTDELDISEFLEYKGVIGIFALLDKNESKIFDELAKELNISQTTLSKRLDEALELQLVSRTRLPEDHGNARRYKLAPKGELIREMMAELELDTKYRELLKLEEEVDTKTSKLGEWVDLNSDFFGVEPLRGPGEYRFEALSGDPEDLD